MAGPERRRSGESQRRRRPDGRPPAAERNGRRDALKPPNAADETTPRLPPQTFYALVVPGIEDLARAELDSLGATVVETLTRFDRRDSIILFRCADIASVMRASLIASVMRASLIEDVFEVVLDAATPKSPHAPRQLARILQRRAIERALVAHHALRPGKRGRSYNVVVRVAGEHPFRRDQVEAAFTAGLDGLLTRWVPDRQNPALELWVHVIGERTIAGIRLSQDVMAQRKYKKAHLPASLKPTVARALVRLAAPTPLATIVDPMCGAGTILREAADASPSRNSASSGRILGGDLDHEALAAARINVGRAASLAAWDARRLPLAAASVDAVITNPPYGRQHEAVPGLGALYRALLREVSRVLRTGGRAVILTGEPRELSEALPKMLRVQSKRRLVVRGLPVTAFVIVRS